MLDRCLGTFLISFHKVNSCKEFICRINSIKALTWDIHKAWKSCTTCNINSLITHLEKLINSKNFTNDHIRFYIYTNSLEIINFFLNDFLRKSELWNTVAKNTTCYMECFINSNLIAKLCKVTCSCKSTWACTNDSNLMAVLLWNLWSSSSVFTMIVSNKSFKTANTNTLTLDASYALTFALVLLWANTTTNSWQCT